MHPRLKLLGGILAVVAATCQVPAQSNPNIFANGPSPGPSRQEIEAYAATNATFAKAIEYFVQTMDGHQPEKLPEGLTEADIERAVRKVFPASRVSFDRPMNFYGKVLDERNQPVAGADIHFEWEGFLIRRASTNVTSDSAGFFAFTNQSGTQLHLSVSKAGYYPTRRNGNVAAFKYAGPQGEVFRPNAKEPVLYYLHKKGVGADSLVTSQHGVYDAFSVPVPLDGTLVKVDLLHRKTGQGPLEISQVKPEHSKWRTATNWSFSMRISGGGFIEEHEEFPFHPPKFGYAPVLEFDFRQGHTNWATDIARDYFIRFGNPPLYGRLRIETSISSSSARLVYAINPDGSRNLEPRNENTPPPAPVALKTNLIQTNNPAASGSVASPVSSNPPPAYKCVTIGGLPGTKGGANGTNGQSLFNEPWGIATDRHGSVYVAESGGSTVRKLTRDGTNWFATTVVGTSGQPGHSDGTNSEARLNHPHGIAIDEDGNLYVADKFNCTIRKIRRVGSDFVTTTIAGRLRVFGNADGTNSDAQFNNPGGITMDRRGNLYVADVQNNAIRKLAPAGTNWIVTTIAGSAGQIREGRIIRPAYGSADGTNSEARFMGPFDVAADSHSSLYVADYGNHTIRKVTQSGTNWIVTTIAGLAGKNGYADGTNSSARFCSPRAVAVDKEDNLYVVDTGTDTVRMIKRVGTNYVVKTIIGKPWRWGYADGTNSTPQFNFASGIAVDSAGNIYLADTGNQTIRQIGQILPPPGPKKTMAFIIISIGCVVALIIGGLGLILVLRRGAGQRPPDAESGA